MITMQLLAIDMRSTHNVGALLRTADCLGVDHVYLCGTSPYPKGQKNDDRLPHIKDKLHSQIHKTALGAEESQSWSYHESVSELLLQLKKEGWNIAALEQDEKSVTLQNYVPKEKTVLLLGTEVTGIEKSVLAQVDDIIEIPMRGKKESLNVIQAAAIASYVLLNT